MFVGSKLLNLIAVAMFLRYFNVKLSLFVPLAANCAEITTFAKIGRRWNYCKQIA